MRPAGVIKLRDSAFAPALALVFALASFASKEVGLRALAVAFRHVLAAALAGTCLASVPFALAVNTNRAGACFSCALGRGAEKGRMSFSEAVVTLEGALGSSTFALAFAEGIQGPRV
jgi:hypothetical protein